MNFKSDIKQKGIKILMSNLKAGLLSLRARPQHVIAHARDSATGSDGDLKQKQKNGLNSHKRYSWLP